MEGQEPKLTPKEAMRKMPVKARAKALLRIANRMMLMRASVEEGKEINDKSNSNNQVHPS